MKRIEFIPLKGIRIDESIYIRFGISMTELREILGDPSKQFNNELYYDELELHIDLDENGQVEFIESIMGPFPKRTEVSIDGINPFKTQAGLLVEKLSELNNGFVDKSEAEYGYSFLEKSIGLYRSSTVKDIEEMIEEMKADNNYVNNEEDVLYELEKSKYFWTIGIGLKGYYDYLKK